MATVTSWLEALTGRHEAHLWHVVPDEIADEQLLDAYRAILIQSEIERNLRFVFERGRRDDLVTRALVRTTLSRYVPEVPPRAWRFATGPYGRPEIAGP